MIHRTRTCASVLALCLAAFLSPVEAKLPSKEYRKLKKELTTSIHNDRWTAAGEALKGLAKDDTKKTFTYLLKLAEKYPMDLALPFSEAVPTFTDEKAVEAARKAAGKTKVLLIRRALLFSFADKKDYGPMIAGLKDKNEDLVYSLITRLTNDRVDAAMEPLLDLADKVEKGKSGTWIELRAALAQLMGQRCNSAEEYRSLWTVLKDQGGLKAAKKLGERETTGAGKKARDVGGSNERMFFGRSITSSKIVLILDTSGSMLQRDLVRRGYGKKPTRPETASGGVEKGGGTQAPKGKNGKGKDGKAGQAAPKKPKRAPTRLERAQRELKKVLDQLDSRVQLNIVTFSGIKAIKVWKPGGVYPLTKANRESAKKFVDSFKASGATATDKALESAYAIKGARAFYLLSDGSPSHGMGANLPPEEVYKVVRKCDRGRGITIHTMGFVGANKKFMQQLSTMTGGRYSDIK
jgi:Mg-chelatase subunit ChlD